MHTGLRHALLAAACLLLAGCGTPAHRAAVQTCHDQSLRTYPLDFERVAVKRQRYEQVKDTKCAPLPDGNKSCATTYRTEPVVRLEYQNVDRNERRRDEMTRQCARDACVASHGNPECKS